MKAILVTEPKIDIVEREMPKIQNSDDVLVKIKAAGICGSDVHIYHGTSPLQLTQELLDMKWLVKLLKSEKM